jgi:glutathione S-transferase kappa 1
LGGIMKFASNTPPASNPFKASYMLKDLQRNAKLYNIGCKINTPLDFPSNSITAMRILSLLQCKSDINNLVAASLAFWKMHWGYGKSFSNENIVDCLNSIGLDGQYLLQNSLDERIKENLKQMTQEACDLGAFGAPWIVCEKYDTKETEIFFGSDRFEALALFLEKEYLGPDPKDKFVSRL